MANKTTDIPTLPELTSAPAGNDQLVIHDVSTNVTKFVTIANSGAGGSAAFASMSGNATTSASLTGTPTQLDIFDAAGAVRNITVDETNGDFTIVTAGVYSFIATLFCATSTATTLILDLGVNAVADATQSITTQAFDASGTDYVTVTLMGEVLLAASDVVALLGSRGGGSPTLGCQYSSFRLALIEAT